MPILQINSLNDFELALKRKEYQATLVYYTAVWCLPSEGIRPYLEEKSLLFKDIQFLKVDVDDQEELAEKTGVIINKGYTVPTFQLYKNGIKIGDDLQRADKKPELENLIKQFSSFSTPVTVENHKPKDYSDENKKITKKSSTCVCL